MNQRVTASTSVSIPRAWAFLTLMLPALTLEVAQTTAPQAFGNGYPLPPPSADGSRPYLAFVGPPPLRFQEEIPPPETVSHPDTGAAAKPVAKTEADTTRMPVLDVPMDPMQMVSASPGKTDVGAVSKPSAKAAATTGTPSVLPDDATPKVRPEDFLPFFQFPGAGTHGADAPAAPAAPPTPATPGTLPPSTATYQQQ
jgi:hypothetical protein